MENKIIEFKAYNPFLKQLRSDKGWRVEFDVSQDEYEIIKELPKLQETVLKISVQTEGEINSDLLA